MNLARKHVTEISKNNENKSKTRQPRSWAPSSIEISKNNKNSKRSSLTFNQILDLF